MYFGRHVVRRPYRRLRPVVGSRRSGEDEHAVTDGADGPVERPVLGDLAPQQLAAQVLTHPGACPPGRIRPSNSSGLDVGPRERRAELLVGLHLRVERLGFGGRAELSEDHAVEQALVGRGRGAAVLGRESHDVAEARQQPPRHRDLGHVEVVVGQRDQDGGDRPTLEETMPFLHQRTARGTSPSKARRCLGRCRG